MISHWFSKNSVKQSERMTVWMVSFTLNFNYSVRSLFLDIDINNPETKVQLYQTKLTAEI